MRQLKTTGEINLSFARPLQFTKHWWTINWSTTAIWRFILSNKNYSPERGAPNPIQT